MLVTSNFSFSHNVFSSCFKLDQSRILSSGNGLRNAFAKSCCTCCIFRIETGHHCNIPRQDTLCEFVFKARVYGLSRTKNVFFPCPKSEIARSNFLLTWYDKGDSPNDLFDILQTSYPRKLKSPSLYISELLRIADE